MRGFFAPKLKRNAIARLPWNVACWFAKLGGFQAQVVTYSDLYFTWLDFCWRTMPPRSWDVLNTGSVFVLLYYCVKSVEEYEREAT